MSPFSGITRELEASPAGIEWVQFDPADKAGWDRIKEIAPMYSPASSDSGAGMMAGKPVDIIEFRYPMLVTYADRSDDVVYTMAKAMDEAFDGYKNVNATMPSWAISKSGKTPADVAWHPGAVKYLKEKGVWTDADEKWNVARKARQLKVQEEWNKADEAYFNFRAAERKKGNKIKAGAGWTEFWMNHRKKAGL